MRTFDLLVPCHFGLEAVLKREIYDLGYEITKVEDGRVTFEGDEEAICRANIFLRTAERVMIQVGRFKATTFEELFQGIKNLPWEEYIPEDGKFWVKKSVFYQQQVVQSIRYPVHCQKSNGGAHETEISQGMVQRRWSSLSGPYFFTEGRSDGGAGYIR